MTEAVGTPAFAAVAKTLLLQVDHRWKLQQEAYRIAQSGGMLSYGGMGEHFGFQLVVGDCMVEQVRGVLKSDLDAWGIDYVQACQIALQNLGKITDMVFVAHDLDGRPQCYESIWKHGDHVARALLADVYQLDLPGESIFIPIGHGKSFVVGDQTRFGMTVVISTLKQSEKERYLMPPFGIDAQGLAWPPRSHPMYPMFRSMQYKYMAKIYEQQREVMLQRRGKEDDSFIAKFVLVSDKDNRHHSKAVITDSTKVTLLPEVDNVIFYENDLDSLDGPAEVSASWAQVMQVFEHRISQTKDYPSRFAFDGFPTQSELDQLKSLDDY